MFSIVPQPLEVVALEGGALTLTSATRILTGQSPAELEAGIVLASVLGSVVDQAIAVVHEDDAEPQPGDIVLHLDEDSGPEGSTDEERYSLDSNDGIVLVTAPTGLGMMRGIATIGQVLHRTPAGEFKIPAMRIDDAPRFAWRGLSLDLARHFFGLEDLKRVVSLMTRYKLNVLHVHLTDDQGWRLELPSRPLLTELSSGTSVGGGAGGFLTGEDFIALQRYAQARGITVIPEIDLPGHTNAALHAYPELNPDGKAKEIYTGIEVGFSTLDASLPATETFLRDVLGDLARMTEGPYVHLGGDEAHGTEKADYEALVSLAASILREHGKIPVGWQEFASSPSSAGGVVQLWDPKLELAPVVEAARAGAQVLLSPANRVYLDMKYHEGFPLGLEWAGYVSLRDSYDWEPLETVPGLEPGSVVGVEAAVWTETLSTFEELSTMLLPRLVAVAEVAWSAPERRDWDSFARRVTDQPWRWERLGHPWHRAEGVDWEV